MRRLIIVYDAKSAKYAQVERKVLAQARKVSGVQVGKYRIGVSRDDAEGLAKLLSDGDIVVAAEGGHTAEVVINGAVLSGKKVRFAIMKIGKFNGFSRLAKIKKLNKALTDKAIEIKKIKIIETKQGMKIKKR